MIDFSVWIPYFNGKITRETNLLDNMLGVQPIAIGGLILAEALQGFRHDRDFLRAKNLLSSLHFFSIGGRDIALKSAENYRFLRQRGITVRKTIDVFIGTFYIENDIALLHSDRDFEPLVRHLGLRVI